MQIQIQFGNAYQKVPVIYHDSYNLKLLPYSMNQLQLMIPDKPAKVYSILQRMFYLIIISIKLLHNAQQNTLDAKCPRPIRSSSITIMHSTKVLTSSMRLILYFKTVDLYFDDMCVIFMNMIGFVICLPLVINIDREKGSQLTKPIMIL